MRAIIVDSTVVPVEVIYAAFTPGEAIQALGPYPILQFFAAVIVLVVLGIGGMAWLRGEKKGKEALESGLDAPRHQEGAVQLFFDGPLRAIFDGLTRLEAAVALGELKNKDATASLLSATRHGVIDAVTQAQVEVEAGMEINRKDVLDAVTVLSREMREMRDMIVRIEENMMRRRH